MDKSNISDWLIYKNNQLIAFNKPAGMPVQADQTADKSLLSLASIYSKSKLHLLHRIDRPASGIVLLAKTKRAIQSLSQQFQMRTIQKTYLAVVQQAPPQTSDTLIHYLKKDSKNKKSRLVQASDQGAKKAVLQYQLLQSSDHYHLLQIELQTGRFHQIRAQLAAIGCPIKGDVKYGARRSNPNRSIHLHAWKMAFAHPISGEQTELVAALPEGALWAFFDAIINPS